MKDAYIITMPECRLRPVLLDDAAFIVKLRNQAHVVGRVNDTPLDVEKQRRWIEAYLARENDYYWIAERNGIPYATQGLYNYVAESRQIETGRWVRSENAPEGNMFAGRVVINDFVFNTLGIKRLVFDVVSTNKPVLKYHRLCGAIETDVEKEKFIIQGRPVDMVWFLETPESWAAVRPKICRWAGIDADKPYGQIEKILI